MSEVSTSKPNKTIMSTLAIGLTCLILFLSEIESLTNILLSIYPRFEFRMDVLNSILTDSDDDD